ncbi:hypothetical protein AB0D78_21505 [Streptomyces avermitilis]|uniref:hypothetical protein n=1 Tax=Streptomyces avermitilis TaxID=33903 RepID=UPI0033EAE41B
MIISPMGGERIVRPYRKPVIMLRVVPPSCPPLSARGVSARGTEVLRQISQQGVPVFLTVHANGRRRYSYWQPATSQTQRGGCQVALPTDECDALHTAGRIVLGDPVVDPSKTTYPVRAAVRNASATPHVPRHVVTASATPQVPRHVVTASATQPVPRHVVTASATPQVPRHVVTASATPPVPRHVLTA